MPIVALTGRDVAKTSDELIITNGSFRLSANVVVGI